MNEVKLHVQGLDTFFADARRMGRGLDRGEQAANASSIAFEDMETLLKVLTPGRWRLLRALRHHGPSSIRALSQRIGRDYRGVHADVSALLDIGLIQRDPSARIRVPWDRITAEMALDLVA